MGRKKSGSRKKKPESILASKVRLAVALVLLASCPILLLLFQKMPDAFFPAYRSFSKALANVLATAACWCPVALWDWMLAYILVMIIATLIRRLWKRMPLLHWASWSLLVVAAICALAVDGWALNHYAPTLASDMGLEVHECSTDELAEATEHYLQEAAALAGQVPREEGGSLIAQDFFEMAPIAGDAYEKQGEEYPIFQGCTRPVKALILFGEPLLYSGHTGIYWATTGESSVPLHTATAEMPFTMCHEAAHRLGIAREQEANFAAFVACTTNDDVRFRYSGCYSAFSYCLNALYGEDPERAQEVVQQVLAENEKGVTLVFADRSATQEHYAAYKGTFEEVGTSVNNSYLKSFGETEGVKSYGLVVDDLIAWHEAGLG